MFLGSFSFFFTQSGLRAHNDTTEAPPNPPTAPAPRTANTHATADRQRTTPTTPDPNPKYNAAYFVPTESRPPVAASSWSLGWCRLSCGVGGGLTRFHFSDTGGNTNHPSAAVRSCW